jgi:purine-cytosine permease-like protein
VEQHSIEPIPLSERYGKTWHLGPLWFTAVAHLGALAVGLIGPLIGASLLTSLLGLVSGVVFGTFFMAFHSAQGPKLGLPQMIQSRAQFGYLGAILPMLAALFVIFGYFVFDIVLIGDAFEATTGGSAGLGITLATIASLVLAVVGYHWIHLAERWLGYTFVVFFGLLTIVAVAKLPLPEGQFSSFQITPFLTLFGIAAGFQLSWAPYVSDYSRYLPPSVGHRAPFWWTYLGSAIGCAWLMSLGAFLAAALPEEDAIGGVLRAGNELFDGYGTFAVLFGLLGLMATCGIGLYTAALTVITMADSVKPITQGPRVRILVLTVIAVLGGFMSAAASADFIANYTTFLLVLLYFMIPWTAINLVDYYIVRRGQYAIRELYNRNGIYGVWSKNGLVSYWVGFLVMIPFFSVPNLYTGPVAAALDGADVAVFVGLPVSAVLYLVMARSLRLDHERQVAEEVDRALEAEPVRPTESSAS